MKWKYHSFAFLSTDIHFFSVTISVCIISISCKSSLTIIQLLLFWIAIRNDDWQCPFGAFVSKKNAMQCIFFATDIDDAVFFKLVYLLKTYIRNSLYLIKIGWKISIQPIWNAYHHNNTKRNDHYGGWSITFSIETQLNN